jgi:hypothetical protein
MTFFRAVIRRIRLIAVVYLKSIPKQGLLDVDRVLLTLHKIVEALSDGRVVLTNHAPFDLVLADGSPYTRADGYIVVISLVPVCEIGPKVLNYICIRTPILKAFQGQGSLQRLMLGDSILAGEYRLGPWVSGVSMYLPLPLLVPISIRFCL